MRPVEPDNGRETPRKRRSTGPRPGVVHERGELGLQNTNT